MAKTPDFVIKYDPDKDSQQDLVMRIFYVLFIKRIKGKKPAVSFVAGDSGEGKSETVLSIIYLLLKMQGVDAREFVDDTNVYLPIQYPEKLNKMLYDKRLKKVNLIAIHEAREAVKAKNWQSFINTAISDVNAMSRSIKPLGFFIISQFIRDIDPSIRYTLTYYLKVHRPIGHNVRLTIQKIWKDDRDLQNPQLKKTRIWGILVHPNGKRVKFFPKQITIARAPKDISQVFEESDRNSKIDIMKRKMDKLISEMQADMGQQSNKVQSMVNWYTDSPERLANIGKQNKRGNWKIHKEVQDMHDINKTELQQFEKLLNVKLLEKGYLKDE